MWSKIPRQYRRIVYICGFLAGLSVIYHAGLSRNITCKDNTHPCSKLSVHGEQQNMLLQEETKDTHIQNEEKRPELYRRGIIDDDRGKLESSPPKTKFKESRVLSTKKTKQKMISSANNGRTVVHPKLALSSTKKTVTLSNEIRNHEVRSVYIQIKEADSPKTGDFECDATIVPKCCAITVEDSHEAKHICEGFGKQCKGFVMSTISSKADTFEYVMYIKNQLNGTMANYLTDFFIKVDFLDQLKWKEEQR